MSRKKFEPALGLTGLYFGSTTQRSFLTSGPTSDLQGYHLRWGSSRYAGYPAYGAQLYHGSQAVVAANLLGTLALDEDQSSRKQSAAYAAVYQESNTVVMELTHDDKALGCGTVVGHAWPYQVAFYQRPNGLKAVQLTLVGAKADATIEATITLLKAGGAAPQVEHVPLRYTEQKTVYLESSADILGVRVQAEVALITRLELFEEGWSTLMADGRLAAATSSPLVVTTDHSVLTNRLHLPQPTQVDLSSKADDFEFLVNHLTTDYVDNHGPALHEYEMESDDYFEHATVEEEAPNLKAHPHDLYHLFGTDAETARLLGAYYIDGSSVALEDQVYIVTSHYVDPGNLNGNSISGHPAHISGVAYSGECLPEGRRPVRGFGQFRVEDMANATPKSGEKLPSAAVGLRLDWELDAIPAGEAREEAITLHLSRTENSANPDAALALSKRLVSGVDEKTGQLITEYWDLMHPQGVKFSHQFSYELTGYDVWGRANTTQVETGKVHYLPTPMSPVGIAVDWSAREDENQKPIYPLNVSFVFGQDHFEADRQVNILRGWLNAYRPKGISGTITKVEARRNDVSFLLSEGDLSDVTGSQISWALKLGGRTYRPEQERQNLDPAYIQENEIVFYDLTGQPAEVKIARSEVDAELLNAGELLESGFRLAPDWRDEATWKAIAKQQKAKVLFEEKFTAPLAPEEHNVEVILDGEKRIIFIQFKDAQLPFATHSNLEPGSLVQDGREYALFPTGERDEQQRELFQVEELYDNYSSFIPQTGKAVIYPCINKEFPSYDISDIAPGSAVMKTLGFCAVAEDLNGTVSAASNPEFLQWVDQSAPAKPTKTLPQTSLPPIAAAPDFNGKSAYEFSWTNGGEQWYLYRTTDDALLAEAIELGKDNGVTLTSLRAQSEEEQFKTMRAFAAQSELDGAFSRITPEPLYSADTTITYVDEDLDGRSSALYLYKLSVLKANQLESPLSDLVAAVRCPTPPVMEEVALQSARTLPGGERELGWQHVADPNLGYYLLLCDFVPEGQSQPTWKHWRNADSKTKILPHENAAPIAIAFGILDLQFLEEEDQPKIEAVYLRKDVESALRNVNKSLDAQTTASELRGVNNLLTDDLEVASGYIRGFDAALEGEPVVVTYSTAATNTAAVYFEHDSHKLRRETTNGNAGAKGSYHYRMIAVSKDEKQISPIGKTTIISI